MKVRTTDKSHAPPFGLYFALKSLPYVVSTIAIYLGYDLFVKGVTGEASIVVNAADVQGQLINAAPGLFFAVGGIIVLVVATIKGTNVSLASGSASDRTRNSEADDAPTDRPSGGGGGRISREVRTILRGPP